MQNKHYFDDLVFLNVNDLTFTSEYHHSIRVYHPDQFSLEMISEGEVFLHIGDEFRLLKAPVVFCTGGNNKFYYFKHPQHKKPYRHLWIHFKGSRGKRIKAAFFRAFPDGTYKLPLTIQSSVLNLFEETYREFHHAGYSDHNALVLKVEQLMYVLLSDLSRKTMPDQDSFRIKELCDMIQNDPMSNYDLEALAESRHISLVYLRKLFRDRYGTPIGKYIAAKRIEKAASMVSEKHYQIGEIADMCGFANLSAFTRAFRAVFGMPPHTFQKNIAVIARNESGKSR